MVDTVKDFTPADITFEYEVIGEHRIDPMRLLTVDSEGRLFELNLATGLAFPTELTEFWVVDTVDTYQYLRSPRIVSTPPTLVVG
jgi:hypothetical protein